jgi:hypothetical protein
MNRTAGHGSALASQRTPNAYQSRTNTESSTLLGIETAALLVMEFEAATKKLEVV